MPIAAIICCDTRVSATQRLTGRYATTNATLPYIMRLASDASASSLLKDRHLAAELNIVQGQLTHRAVADALEQTRTEPGQILRTSLHLKSA